MARKNDDLLKRLLATFRVEAAEHLQAMTAGLLALEKASAGAEAAGIIETVFREAHSLKGAARAVNLAPVESLCQSLESVFSALKKEQAAVSLPLLDLLHQAIEGLGALLPGDSDAGSAMPPEIAALMRRLEQAVGGGGPGDFPGPGPASTPAAADRETAAAPAETSAAAGVAHAPSLAFGAASGTVRISTGKLDTVMRQVEELLSPRLAAR